MDITRPETLNDLVLESYLARAHTFTKVFQRALQDEAWTTDERKIIRGELHHNAWMTARLLAEQARRVTEAEPEDAGVEDPF
jgi:hypothetical protein